MRFFTKFFSKIGRFLKILFTPKSWVSALRWFGRIFKKGIKNLLLLFKNFHFWLVVALFIGSILLHYPQLIPNITPLEPDSFLFLTRHSIGRLILLLPITYTALVFGIRAGIFSLFVALAILLPNLFLLPIIADDLIEIIGIVVIGLVVNLWLESYWADRKHRQEAYLKLESAQRELQRMQQNLRFYLKQITIAQEEERRRIAQELHDDTAQNLIVISRKLDSFVFNSKKLSPEDVLYFEEIRSLANSTLQEVRRFSQDLRPSILDDLGLLPALEWLAPEISKFFKINIELKIEGTPRRFPPETELVLFRLVQEALRNTGKHAEARNALITIRFKGAKTTVIIEDDGKGFNVPKSVSDLTGAGKLGLVGMQERAQLIGADFLVESEPNAGTAITIKISDSKNIRASLLT